MLELPLFCPDCHRALRPVTNLQHATQAVRRKCPGCGEQWQVVVAPRGHGKSGWVHELTWARTQDNPFEQPEPPDELYDPEQLAAGIEVEREHTTDRRIAKRIAKDHLDEDPEYYVKLKTLGLNPPTDLSLQQLVDVTAQRWAKTTMVHPHKGGYGKMARLRALRALKGKLIEVYGLSQAHAQQVVDDTLEIAKLLANAAGD